MDKSSSPNRVVELHGVVTTGDKKAQEFLSLSGYTDQFIQKLGYEPYPGTLNLELGDKSVTKRSELKELEPILIEEWDDGGDTYGGVLCYPGEIATEGMDAPFEECHLIVPKRTTHEKTIVEVIASRNLRNELDVEDGDSLTVRAWSG